MTSPTTSPLIDMQIILIDLIANNVINIHTTLIDMQI
jgi:hypothetical protein